MKLPKRSIFALPAETPDRCSRAGGQIEESILHLIYAPAASLLLRTPKRRFSKISMEVSELYHPAHPAPPSLVPRFTLLPLPSALPAGIKTWYQQGLRLPNSTVGRPFHRGGALVARVYTRLCQRRDQAVSTAAAKYRRLEITPRDPPLRRRATTSSSVRSTRSMGIPWLCQWRTSCQSGGDSSPGEPRRRTKTSSTALQYSSMLVPGSVFIVQAPLRIDEPGQGFRVVDCKASCPASNRGNRAAPRCRTGDPSPGARLAGR